MSAQGVDELARFVAADFGLDAAELVTLRKLLTLADERRQVVTMTDLRRMVRVAQGRA